MSDKIFVVRDVNGGTFEVLERFNVENEVLEYFKNNPKQARDEHIKVVRLEKLRKPKVKVTVSYE